MNEKRPPRRGRPLGFDDEMRAYLAELVRRHGARGAIVASRVPVSLGTLLRIARERRIPLRRGRRKRAGVTLNLEKQV